MGKSSLRGYVIDDISFPCLDKLNNDRYEGKLPVLSRSGSNTESVVKYPCGHRMDDLVIVRCPESMMPDCEGLVVKVSRQLTSLRDFILFDPRQTVFEKLPRVTDQCPACFFKPLLFKYPCCCSCGKFILVGDTAHLVEKKEKGITRMGIMRAVQGGRNFLVRCTQGECGRKRKRALLVWDGEKLVPFRDYAEKAKPGRRAA